MIIPFISLKLSFNEIANERAVTLYCIFLSTLSRLFSGFILFLPLVPFGCFFFSSPFYYPVFFSLSFSHSHSHWFSFVLIFSYRIATQRLHIHSHIPRICCTTTIRERIYCTTEFHANERNEQQRIIFVTKDKNECVKGKTQTQLASYSFLVCKHSGRESKRESCIPAKQFNTRTNALQCDRDRRKCTKQTMMIEWELGHFFFKNSAPFFSLHQVFVECGSIYPVYVIRSRHCWFFFFFFGFCFSCIENDTNWIRKN